MQDDHPTFGHYRPRGLMAGLIAVTGACSGRWLGKRRAHFLRSIGIAALRGRPLDLAPLGARMRLHPAGNNVEKRLAFTPQYFDAAERDYLEGIMRDDIVFVDVGADVGGYALFVAARAGGQARILAVEPQPDIFERLVFNIRQNGFATVKALACAVSDQDGPVTLFVNPKDSGETSMRTVNAHAKGRQLAVQGRTLAGLITEEGLTRIDVLKLDIEGAEELVLGPFFADAPARLWPEVLIVDEASGWFGVDLPALFERCAYSVVQRTATNIIYRRQSRGLGAPDAPR